ncbi:Putative uncharacterized protein [Halomonas sp. R57-5]|nr:Putative uncharacterized protein [Halomonas sp. R57-5]
MLPSYVFYTPRAGRRGGCFKKEKKCKEKSEKANFTQQRTMLTALFKALAEVLLGLAYTGRQTPHRES